MVPLLFIPWACSFDESVVNEPCTTGATYGDQICRDGSWYPRPDGTDGVDDGGPPDDTDRDGTGRDTATVDDGGFPVDTGDGGSGSDTVADTNPDRDGSGSDTGADTHDHDADSRGGPGAPCDDDSDCLGTCADGICAHRIVVTSKTWSGNLGGLEGADTKCQTEVADELPGEGTWKAIISGPNEHAYERISSNIPIYNLGGEKVADKTGDLWGKPLAHAVEFDESGDTHTGEERLMVWSGTDRNNGQWDGHEEGGAQDCEAWTSSSSQHAGEVGASDRTDSHWIQDADDSHNHDRSCHLEAALYCIDGQ
ncbi:MAG: DUF1554 domain-containing protein [Bradymonadaceae bacterium]